MFANTQLGGLDFADLDVCLPGPLPFGNTGLGMLAINPAWTVLFMCLPAHHILTITPLTFGDEAGFLGGVISHTIMGPSLPLTACFSVLVWGLPATRMTGLTMQNLINAGGIRLVPSQFQVLLLGP